MLLPYFLVACCLSHSSVPGLYVQYRNMSHACTSKRNILCRLSMHLV
jgi:hypothetical protein